MNTTRIPGNAQDDQHQKNQCFPLFRRFSGNRCPSRLHRRIQVLICLGLALGLLMVWAWWLWQGTHRVLHVERATYRFLAVTSQPDLARQQIAARWVSAQSPAQSELLYAPGPVPLGRAIGRLQFLNEGTAPVTISSALLVGTSGIAVTFNGPITIPATPPLVALVLGYTVQPGIVALPAFDLDQPCCAPGVFVKSEAFALASALPSASTIPSGTVEQELAALSHAAMMNMPMQLEREHTVTEGVVTRSFQCLPQSQVQAGGPRSLIVQARVLCREAVYNLTQVTAQARALLWAQAICDLGPHATLVGPLTVQVREASADAGQIVLQAEAQGTWQSSFLSAHTVCERTIPLWM
jgi:hypothetical protein